MPAEETPAPQGRRANGYPVGQRTRARIQGAALREFAEYGYRGSTMTRIADRVGISEAGLRHHFRSKDELLIEILRDRDRDRATDDRWGDAGRPIGKADLEYNRRLLELNLTVPDLARLFAVVIGESVTVDHPAADWARDRYRALGATMAYSVRGGIAAGEYRADIDPDRIGRQIIAVMDGLQLQWLLDPERVDPVADFDAYAAALIRDLRVRD
ncbi:TetR/AcrR family transcriptional regulator [Microbacterium sp. 13-71-7]|jgi:AcrR family transcriptional regulator|uniref:TetR/AcrR family transcriptional regulator n=1 Tax=Microbacterium sp. 13-71-7 TaxID=1970399 RepID=UPI0025F1A8A0|nr:TetR/AcrR family transcriptional regulator [Microbacterium sp. 13-71-7]